jgi:hypothetical protein
MANTESEAPIRAMPRRDKDDARFPNSKSETVDPNRAKLRSAIEAPSKVTSNTDSDAPNRGIPKTAMEEPQRTNARIENVLPN